MNARRIACLASVAASVLVLAACKVPGTERVSDAATPIMTAFVTNYTGNFTYKLDVGSDPRDVYFVFSNKSVDTGSGSAEVKNLAGPISVDGKTIAYSSAQPAGSVAASTPVAKAKELLARTNRDLASLGASGGFQLAAGAIQGSKASYVSASADVVNASKSFYDIDSTGQYMISVPAHCRYAGPTINTAQGARRLRIWVADNCWSSDGVTEGNGSIALAASAKKHVVTQPMVDAMVAKFLDPALAPSSSGSDIFSWDTNILGPEWGTPAGTEASQLIPFDGTITIFLSDIMQDNNDNGYGGIVVGYFWDANNHYTDYKPASNERIMFVIDAEAYANPNAAGTTSFGGSGWAPTHYWAEECFSTLAHEFQHMIQYYQKGIVARGDGESADTWINEMCSQLTEDLVAYDMHVEGPRGVDWSDPTAGAAGNTNGRIRDFNTALYSDNRQLTKLNDYDVWDYAFSYAFGSWLLREYGGTEFLKRVVQSRAMDEDAITDAVKAYSGQSFSLGDLVQRWSVAVLGSSSATMPLGYRYNRGSSWVDSAAGGHTYHLGSINFFNYSPVPGIIDGGSGSTDSLPASANVYYKAATGMTGDDSWKLSLPDNVAFSVYVTP
jgi:hypothetical protein